MARWILTAILIVGLSSGLSSCAHKFYKGHNKQCKLDKKNCKQCKNKKNKANEVSEKQEKSE